MREDSGYYDYWPYKNRPKITWPNGARLAFWVAPNIEFYELNPPANPFRAAWPTPAPSIPGYSIRDYGNRVGHVRQMQLLDKYGIRGSISLSAALCEHHPEIIAMLKASRRTRGTDRRMVPRRACSPGRARGRPCPSGRRGQAV